MRTHLIRLATCLYRWFLVSYAQLRLRRSNTQCILIGNETILHRYLHNLRSLGKKAKWLYLESGLNISEALVWWKYNTERSKALKMGTRAFLHHLRQGEKELDQFHSELCGIPPIPVKRC